MAGGSVVVKSSLFRRDDVRCPALRSPTFWDVDTLTTARLGASSQQANPSIRCLDPASTPLKLSISTDSIATPYTYLHEVYKQFVSLQGTRFQRRTSALVLSLRQGTRRAICTRSRRRSTTMPAAGRGLTRPRGKSQSQWDVVDGDRVAGDGRRAWGFGSGGGRRR
jgi:hypothetical protein